MPGRIGRPGMGPFSVTGQPNAMGGREVGGLANQLAAHMDFSDPRQPERVARFWNAPRIATAPGLKAVDLFAALETGAVRAIWIMGTNPAVSLPDGDRLRRALGACDFVAVADCSRASDTAGFAHVLLPALAWGEKDGTVTNSERRISRQRRFLPPPGEARADWWMLTQVARRLGFGAAFPYRSAADVFREHAALSGFENDGTRAFDIGGLADLDDPAYDALAPIQWPVTVAAPGAQPHGTARLFGDGRFVTPDGRARFLPITPRAPTHPPTSDFPLVLNTGRVRDQWHTMTRTAKAPTLATHHAEPTVALHPETARRRQLYVGALARVTSAWGSMLARVVLDPGLRPSDVFVPMHWSDAVARSARVDALVNPALDPVSGQPELKHTPVRVAPAMMAWHGFVVTRRRLALAPADYRVAIKRPGGWRYEIAGMTPRVDWRALLTEAFGDTVQLGEVTDRATASYRATVMDDGGLQAALFVGPRAGLPARGWLDGLLADGAATPDPLAVLAGQPLGGQIDAGPQVCACFGVGAHTLAAAIADGCTSVEAIGARLRAGTNCGSCLPEIRVLLAQTAPVTA
jgi:assimilatory nitrate reductase catalytic subunit